MHIMPPGINKKIQEYQRAACDWNDTKYATKKSVKSCFSVVLQHATPWCCMHKKGTVLRPGWEWQSFFGTTRSNWAKQDWALSPLVESSGNTYNTKASIWTSNFTRQPLVYVNSHLKTKRISVITFVFHRPRCDASPAFYCFWSHFCFLLARQWNLSSLVTV